jgi:hypothetical protein
MIGVGYPHKRSKTWQRWKLLKITLSAYAFDAEAAAAANVAVMR